MVRRIAIDCDACDKEGRTTPGRIIDIQLTACTTDTVAGTQESLSLGKTLEVCLEHGAPVPALAELLDVFGRPLDGEAVQQLRDVVAQHQDPGRSREERRERQRELPSAPQEPVPSAVVALPQQATSRRRPGRPPKQTVPAAVQPTPTTTTAAPALELPGGRRLERSPSGWIYCHNCTPPKPFREARLPQHAEEHNAAIGELDLRPTAKTDAP